VYIIIAGAGIVGMHIASVLVEGKHEVTIVEPSDAVVEGVRHQLDVKTITGNATAPRVLREAEVSRADLIIAVTNNDETNMLICFLAKELGATMTVGRVRNPEYSGYFVTAAKSPSAARKIVRPKTLGIDLIINPEVAVADEMVQLLCGLCPSPVSSFANGRIQIGEFKIDQKSLINKTLEKIKFPVPCITAAIARGANTFIPSSDTVLQKDDHIYLLSSQESMSELTSVFTQPQPPVRNVVVFGGRRVGYLVADGLEKQGISVMVIEDNYTRSQEIAAELKKATVIHGDATNRDFLIEQGVPSADAFVSTTENDELNILCALLAKNLGVPRALVSLNKPGYIALAEAIGADLAVSPLLLTASKIAHFVLHGGAISAVFIGGQEIQAIEFAVNSTASIAQRSIPEAGLPKEVLCAAIIRDDKLIIPPDDSIIYPGDHLIVVSPLSATSSVEKLFK
jgi:trk system potassium uptake protein TrkA